MIHIHLTIIGESGEGRIYIYNIYTLGGSVLFPFT